MFHSSTHNALRLHNMIAKNPSAPMAARLLQGRLTTPGLEAADDTRKRCCPNPGPIRSPRQLVGCVLCGMWTALHLFAAAHVCTAAVAATQDPQRPAFADNMPDQDIGLLRYTPVEREWNTVWESDSTGLWPEAGRLSYAEAYWLAQQDANTSGNPQPPVAADESKPSAGAPAGSAPTGASPQSADEVAKQLANPNNSLASLTFKNQVRWYDGDLPNADDQVNYTLLFQPVFPFPMGVSAKGGKANLFVRPAFPILIDQPIFNAGRSDFSGKSGLGDIGFDIGYGVTEKNGFLWALGMVGTIPTATDSAFAGKQLRLGPEALLAKFEKWGLYGVFPSHQWNVTGWDDRYHANTQIQPLFKVLPGSGWSVGSTPIMNYDWQADEWSIPLNLTVGKTVVMGKTPLKLEVEINYYVERPDLFGAEWMLGFNVTPVVKNFVDEWFH